MQYDKDFLNEDVIKCFPNMQLIKDQYISSMQNNIIIHKNKLTALHIGVLLTHLDYEERYKNRKDYKRRVSVLIMSDFNTAKQFFSDMKISGKYLFNRCIDKQNKFLNENDMDDPYNAQSHWNYFYYKKYNIPLKTETEIRYVDFFPVRFGINGTKMTRDHFGKYDSQKPVYYISHNHKIFLEDNLPVIDYIVIDYTYMKKYIPDVPKNIKTVFCFDTILNDKIIYCSGNKTELYWESNELNKAMGNETLHDDSFLNNLQKFKIINIKPDFEAELKIIGQLISDRHFRKKNEEFCNCVSRFYYMALACPVRAIDFDEVVAKIPYKQTFTDLINEMQDKFNIYDSKNLLECYESCRKILNSLDKKCEKFTNLINRINTFMRLGKKIAVIFANETNLLGFKNAYTYQTGNPVNDYYVHCSTMKQISIEDKKLLVDCIIYTVCDSIYHLQIINAIKAEKSEIILYNPEISIINSRLNKIKEALQNCNTLTMIRTFEKYGLDGNGQFQLLDCLIKKFKTDIEPKNMVFPDIESLILNNSNNYSPIVHNDQNNYECVMARKVLVEQNGKIFAEDDDIFNVLSIEKDDFVEKTLDKLVEGDLLVLIEGKSRKQLYEIILDGISQTPKIQAVSFLIRLWQKRIREGYIMSKMTYTEIYHSLKKILFKKSYPVVRSWINGQTMGPNNLKDIELMAEILNLPDIKQLAPQIFQSLREVRKVRQQIAKILNKTIKAVNMNIKIENSDKLEKYGIFSEDLKAAVQLVQVQSISIETFPVRKTDLGVIFYYEE